MIIVYGILIFFGALACYVWAKICYGLYKGFYNIINNKKIREENNPYIKAQKLIDKNNQDYQNYINWMQKNSNGVPLDKIMTKEEFTADQEIKKLIS